MTAKIQVFMTITNKNLHCLRYGHQLGSFSIDPLVARKLALPLPFVEVFSCWLLPSQRYWGEH